jgi:hypothetical protein
MSGSTIFFYIISQRARFLAETLENKTYILISFTTFVSDISNSEKNLVINVLRYSRKVPFILVVSGRNVYNQIRNFTKILPVSTEFFHVDRRTDRYDEANSGFSQFSEIAEKQTVTA